MKVTHLVSGLAGGGAEKVILDLCNQSRNDPHIQMEVVSLSYINQIAGKFSQFIIFPKNITEAVRPPGRIRSTFSAIRFLSGHQTHLIHAHMFYACIAACVVKLIRPRTKVVFSLHNSFQPRFVYRLLLFLTRSFRTADVTFPNTARSWYMKKHPVVIANGIDTAVLTIPPMEKEPIFTFVFAGRLHPQKQPLVLIEIAKQLSLRDGPPKAANRLRSPDLENNEQEFLPFRIIVAGTGPLLSPLVNESRAVGLDRYFEFTGFRNDVPELLARSHCLLLPSAYEGMPLIVLEAAAAGVPIICTPEAVRAYRLTSNDAYICNTSEFADCAQQVIQDYSTALQKATALRDKLSAFTIGKTYQAHKDLYGQVSAH